MRLRFQFVFWFFSESSGQRVPARELVTAEMIGNSWIDIKTEDTSSLLGKYIRSLNLKLQSLSSVIASGDSFHTDAVFFSLLDTPLNIARLESSIKNTSSSGSKTFDLSEYEILLKSLSIAGAPGINDYLKNASILAGLSEAYVRNYEIIYIANVLDAPTYERVLKETNRLWASQDIEANCNLNGGDRMGGYVHFSPSQPTESQRESFYSLIFGNEELRLLVSSIVGAVVHPSDFPIELREYGTQSRGMGCHADIQMYRDLKTNFELVLTVSNLGKCEVYWYDRSNVKHSVWPEPNSLTIVHPASVVHCVGPTQGGAREMLKFIMVGSYGKSKSFYDYVDNQCDSGNSNVIAMQKRRSTRANDEL